MQLNVRTIKNESFPVEVPDDAKVADAKARIFEIKGEGYETDQQQLILQGKILADDQALSALNLTPASFFVLFTRPKGAKAAAPKPAAQPSTAPVAEPAKEKAEEKPAPQTAPVAAPSQEAHAAPGAPSGASVFAVGPELEQAVSSIVDMGFEREMVLKAMRAAFNNPERAVEYLMTGIPEMGGAQGGQGQPPAASPAAHAPAAQAPAAPAREGADADAGEPLNIFGGGGGGGGAAQEMGGSPDPAADLAMLQDMQSHPSFQAFRAAIGSNPNLLPQLLHGLAQTQPDLVEAILRNQQEFLQIIRGEGGEDAEGMEGAETIELTQEEMAAIQRLEALGFDRHACVEAYLICDKNEEMAANYLLENGMQD